MYIQIRDDIADQIIEHGLSKTESKLFFYLLKLDRFGDKPVKVKVAEILLATGIGKTAYHQAMTKFEMLGWFDFKHSDVEITNNCTPAKQFGIPNSESGIPEKRTGIPEKRTGKTNQKTGKTNSRRSKPLPGEGSTASHTIQTYTDYLRSLSDSEREKFISFAQRTADKLPTRPVLIDKWIADNFDWIKAEFKKSADEPTSPLDKSAANAGMTLDDCKRLYPNSWREAAAHFGLEATP